MREPTELEQARAAMRPGSVNRQQLTDWREQRAELQEKVKDKVRKLDVIAREDRGTSKNATQMIDRLEADRDGLQQQVESMNADIRRVEGELQAEGGQVGGQRAVPHQVMEARTVDQHHAAGFAGSGSMRAGGSNGAGNRGGQILAEGIRALSGGSGLGQVITPPEHAGFVLDHLAAQSVGLTSGFTVLETDRDTLELPHSTSDGGANWTSEGEVIANTDVGAETITAVPRKLGALQQTSNEVINDANPSVLDVVYSRLIRAMGLKLDLGFYQGSGTAPEIRGLANVAGIQSVSMGTDGGAFVNLDPIADALGLLSQENANGSAIVLHPRTWKALAKLKEETAGNNKPLLQESAGSGSQGIVRSIYGVPVYLSSQVSITEVQGTSGAVASSAYVYDAARIFAVRRQEVTLEVDRSRLFNSDQSEIRAISRWDVVVPDPECVVRISGVIA